MSLFFRTAPRADERAVTSLPWSHGGDHPGMTSMESSLALVPVFAATRKIADEVSTMPLQAFRRTPAGRSPIALPTVLANPDQNGSRIAWLERCMMSLLLRGNAYGLKSGYDAATAGGPKTITWLDPDLVDYSMGKWYFDGAEVADELMFHIPALVLPGQRLGISPLQACRATMEAGLSTQTFMAEWYKNKAVPGMVFQNTEQIIEADVAAKAKERLRSTLRSGDPFVTGKDWKLEVVKLSAEDAGFVMSAKMNATQVASVFGLPPEEIGGETGSSLHYSTEELNQIKLQRGLRHWYVRLEEAFSTLLPQPQYVKFNVDAGIRVDTKTRYEVHQIARQIGLNNVDELRALEDREPLPNGAGKDYAPLAVKPAPTPTATS